MARVQVTTRALADLERPFDFLADHNPKLARERMFRVRRAFELPADHPLLGREAEDGRRELILSRGKFGCVAKCRWLPAEGVVDPCRSTSVGSGLQRRLATALGHGESDGDCRQYRTTELVGMAVFLLTEITRGAGL